MKGRALQYMPQELDWIEANKGLPRAEACALFCARWERDDVSLSNYNALCKRKGWMTGRTGHFAKDKPPHNKGKRMPHNANSAATRFKSGNRPHNYRGAGHESTCAKDGYVYLIIHDENARTKTKTRRVLKHKWLWEDTNGPVPRAMALKCQDGNRQNSAPSNWILVPRAILPRLAGGKVGVPYDAAHPDLKPSILAVARLSHAAKEGSTQ